MKNDRQRRLGGRPDINDNRKRLKKIYKRDTGTAVGSIIQRTADFFFLIFLLSRSFSPTITRVYTAGRAENTCVVYNNNTSVIRIAIWRCERIALPVHDIKILLSFDGANRGTSRNGHRPVFDDDYVRFNNNSDRGVKKPMINRPGSRKKKVNAI